MKTKQGWDTADKGESFEQWVQLVLADYAGIVNKTNSIENYDLNFKWKDKNYILECKCYSYWHKHGGNRRGEMSLQRCQIRALRKMRGKDIEIIYVCGITFNDYDMYVVTIPFNRVLELEKEMNGKNYVTVGMHKLINEKPFRFWISEMFGVDKASINLPVFSITKGGQQYGRKRT